VGTCRAKSVTSRSSSTWEGPSSRPVSRDESRQPVVYGELPGAQHAFEIFHSLRTDHTVNAVGHFLEWTHARWQDN